jgi:hypothetical protein
MYRAIDRVSPEPNSQVKIYLPQTTATDFSDDKNVLDPFNSLESPVDPFEARLRHSLATH